MNTFPFEFTEFTDMKNNPLLKKFISEKELPCIYGYTVNFEEEKVTALFMVSTIPTCNLNSKKDILETLLNYISKSKTIIKHGEKEKIIEVKNLWNKRRYLSKKLEVPLYVVLWNDNCVYLIDISKGKYTSINDIEDLEWKKFAEKLATLKSIKKQPKKLMYVETPPFEKRLLKFGVSGPGDLDGFEIIRIGGKEKIILYEFSTRNLSCKKLEEHDPNKFMNQDYRRWTAPMILKKQLENSSINLVIWSPCCRDKIIIWEDIELEKDKNGNFLLKKGK